MGEKGTRISRNCHSWGFNQNPSRTQTEALFQCAVDDCWKEQHPLRLATATMVLCSMLFLLLHWGQVVILYNSVFSPLKCQMPRFQRENVREYKPHLTYLCSWDLGSKSHRWRLTKRLERERVLLFSKCTMSVFFREYFRTFPSWGLCSLMCVLPSLHRAGCWRISLAASRQALHLVFCPNEKNGRQHNLLTSLDGSF